MPKQKWIICTCLAGFKILRRCAKHSRETNGLLLELEGRSATRRAVSGGILAACRKAGRRHQQDCGVRSPEILGLTLVPARTDARTSEMIPPAASVVAFPSVP